MARPGPRHAEPENLAVDGAADHGCSGLPLRADCQRQRRKPVKQDTPGFAAPPTGPNKIGKLASANTRPPTARLCDLPALPTASLSTSAAGIDRRRNRKGQARLGPGRGRRSAAGAPHRSQHRRSHPDLSGRRRQRAVRLRTRHRPRPSRVIPASKLGPRTQNRAPRSAIPKTETQAVLPQTRP